MMDREELITVLEKAFEITGLPCLEKSTIQLKADGERIAELEGWINVAGGIKCPACDNVGWYVGFNGEQEQCQFCYECPESIFNRQAAKELNKHE